MSRKYKFEIYKDLSGEFRFRVVAPNGEIVADSAESYTSLQMCKENIKNLILKIPEATIKIKKDNIINNSK